MLNLLYLQNLHVFAELLKSQGFLRSIYKNALFNFVFSNIICVYVQGSPKVLLYFLLQPETGEGSHTICQEFSFIILT